MANTDIYNYGGDPSYGGGTNLGAILGAIGSLPMSVIKKLYEQPGLPVSNTFDQRFGNLPPAQTAALPAPINVGAAPQINTTDVPQTQQPPIMDQQLTAGGPDPSLISSPVATGGQGGGAGPMAGPMPVGRGPLGALGTLFDMLGSGVPAPQQDGGFNPLGAVKNVLGVLGNGLERMSIAGNPQLQQAYYGRIIFNQMYQSLLARGMPPDKALAIASSPQLQQQFYGLPQSAGTLQLGKTGIPLYQTGEGIQSPFGPLGQGQGGLNQVVQMGNEIEREQAAAEATGTQQGKNLTGLSNTATNLDAAIGTIDSIVKDPATKNIIGAGVLNPKRYFPGSPEVDAQNKLNDLKGQLIPAAVQELQASGAAIRNPTLASDVAKSISDVDAAQKGSPKAFMDSMNRLRMQLVKLKQNAYTSAGQQAPFETQAPQSGGLSGTTQSGVKWSISQ